MAIEKIRPLFDRPLLNVMLLSDTHQDQYHPHPDIPQMFFKDALDDFRDSECPVDAIFIAGDVTSRGSDENWALFRECLEGRDIPPEKLIMAIGNHDTWNDESVEAALNNYIKNRTAVTSIRSDKVYFSTTVKGYHVICMGSEGDNGCSAIITDEQIAWLKDELDKAAKSGKPIFVINHQSLNQKHGLPVTWDADESSSTEPWEGGIGDSSDKVEKLLKEYKNVLFITGHSHMGWTGQEVTERRHFSSVERDGTLNLLNMPSLACGNHHGVWSVIGIGGMLEVYEDRMIIRPRDYHLHIFNTEYPVQNGKPYFEIPLD